MEYSEEQQREHRREWTAKLRSGDIPQFKGQMRQWISGSTTAPPQQRKQGFTKKTFGDRMCVLGVGCEVSGLGKWDAGSGCYSAGNELEGHFLPEVVRNYYGLASSDGTSSAGCLAGMNDKLGLSFEQLAAVLDAEPEGLLESDPGLTSGRAEEILDGLE